MTGIPSPKRHALFHIFLFGQADTALSFLLTWKEKELMPVAHTRPLEPPIWERGNLSQAVPPPLFPLNTCLGRKHLPFLALISKLASHWRRDFTHAGTPACHLGRRRTPLVDGTLFPSCTPATTLRGHPKKQGALPSIHSAHFYLPSHYLKTFPNMLPTAAFLLFALLLPSSMPAMDLKEKEEGRTTKGRKNFTTHC